MILSKPIIYRIEEPFRVEFKEEITRLNLNRAKLLMIAIMVIDTILWLTNRYFINRPITIRYAFPYIDYGNMYVGMILVSAFFLVLVIKLKKRCLQNENYYKPTKILLVAYLTFTCSWAAIISLLDQRLYGNIAAYLTALMICSIVFYIESSLIIIPYLVSLAILAGGLPYFQNSETILIGHYVNTGIFAILSWTISRTLFGNFVKDFAHRCQSQINNKLLLDINQQLLNEIVAKEEMQKQLEKANQELENISLIDALTGIPNRRNLDQFLSAEWKRATREGSSIAILMIDIDYFKALNDNYGHLYGDDCLANVAKTIDACRRRSTDFVARLGGEEFLFIAVNLNPEGVKILAEKIRDSIEHLNIIHEYSDVAPYLTVSIGATIVYPSIENSIAESINKSDRALYKSKLAGRNRVGILI